MDATTPTSLTALEPGVYIGLSNEAYHRDEALGSTNLRSLAPPHDPSAYWWNARHLNPMAPEDIETKDRLRGNAIHAFVLEGQQSFDGRYIRRPDDPEGATAADKSAITKKANATAAAQGRASIHGNDYDRIMISGKMITANPELAQAFTGGMSEISVFWQRDGVRFKSRADYSKLRAITDLKSIANILQLDFKEACWNEFHRRDHPMQAKHYIDGREQMRKFVSDGRIFGMDHDRDLLKKIAASDQYAFAFVYFQAKNTPLTHGIKLSPGNPYLDFAGEQIEAAIERYKTFREKFGASMWVLREPLQEAEIENAPSWYGRSFAK